MKMKKGDNRGSTMVMVIVTMAFVGILVSIILYMSLLNFRIKTADVRNKNSFYTAENALDEIKAGLEGEISKAIGEAYLAVMEHYGDYSDTERNEQFTWHYVNSLRTNLRAPGQDNRYQVSILTGYLQDTAWDDAAGCGARITADTADTGEMIARTDGVVLKNVMVTYVADDGMVSRIKTDIRLVLPEIFFNASFKLPDVLSYSLIANDEMRFNMPSTVQGSIYGGKNGIFVDGCSVAINGADLIVTDKLLHIDNASLHIAGDSNLWAEGIDVGEGSNVDFRGSVYVRDDLTVNGNNSSIIIGSTYYGYGRNDADALYSSAILINGLNTKLDMSRVNRLYLAGRSYIKTAGTISVGGSDRDNQNVRMGESLAVKSDQLAYLVPVECLWVKDGENLCTSNPVEVGKIADFEREGAVEVDFDAVARKLGVPLGNYANGFQKVYKNVSGVQLVYYYLTFDSELSANRFFKEYYEADKERMDDYLKVYVSDLKLPVDSMLRVNLAGNVFTMEAGNFVLKDATAVTDDTAALRQESEGYATAFDQLCTILSRTNPTSEQRVEKENNGIFYNVINKEEFDRLVASVGNKWIRYSDDNTAGVVVINNAGGSPYKLSEEGIDWSKIKILIVSGDLIVDRNFTGIMIAGGTVTSQAGWLMSDADGASKAMQITSADGSFMVVNLFVDGSYVAGAPGGGTSGPKVTVWNDFGYGAEEASFFVGRYNQSDLFALGLQDWRSGSDNTFISSMKIPEGYRMIAYKGPNFDGESKVFEGDVWYVGDDWNDKINSIIVESIDGEPTDSAGGYDGLVLFENWSKE